MPTTAFVLSDVYERNTEFHITKLNQFINLVNLNDISVTIDNQLPTNSIINEYSLCFIDCYDLESEDSLPDEILQLALSDKLVLFNCKKNAFCEKLALLAGVQGVFYLDDKADIVIKGLDNIKNNDRWFKRSVMNMAISDLLKGQVDKRVSEIKTNTVNRDHSKLTKREKMIANLISSGAQNKEIAEQLHISPNTVKTHLYSIFRKTRSRNRIELLAWSQQCSLN